MTEIQEIVVDPVIPTTRFRCNLARCKGACCTIPGGKGAPLLDDEIAEIHAAFPVVRQYLSPQHLKAIEDSGLYEHDNGGYVTTCVDEKACVFVTYEDGIARCAFEKAYLKGEIAWRKPLSCHLFPIRIDRGLKERVRFEFLEQCTPALEEGSVGNVFLSDFVREALIRAYGEDWYREFLEYCQNSRKNDSFPGTQSWQP